MSFPYIDPIYNSKLFFAKYDRFTVAIRARPKEDNGVYLIHLLQSSHIGSVDSDFFKIAIVDIFNSSRFRSRRKLRYNNGIRACDAIHFIFRNGMR